MTTTKTYQLEMKDGSGYSEFKTLESDSLDEAIAEAEEMTESWIEGGDWGDDGASVDGFWILSEEDEEGEWIEVESGSVTVEIEPDHDRLIRRVVGSYPGEDFCGYNPDDHDWTSEGEGGLKENPGVWSTGGTSMMFKSHCRKCGLRRTECTTGSQKNPGEHDSVQYEMPDSWCE